MFYELKLRTTKVNKEKGVEKEVTEKYITDCGLFAEAELKGLQQYKKCDVTHISRSDVREIVNPEEGSDKDNFYKATIVDIFINDDGSEKELKYKVLVAADSLDEATKKTLAYMEQGLQDMRLDGIVKTKILEII